MREQPDNCFGHHVQQKVPKIAFQNYLTIYLHYLQLTFLEVFAMSRFSFAKYLDRRERNGTKLLILLIHFLHTVFCNFFRVSLLSYKLRIEYGLGISLFEFVFTISLVHIIFLQRCVCVCFID